jgi:RND family efflux transporter MFP subunit
MSAPNASSRALIKVAAILAVLVTVGIFVSNQFRTTAVVTTVSRGTALDIVTGSLTVHADHDLQEIRSELPGRVDWIDTRPDGALFKEGEPIVKLDTKDLERDMKIAEDDYNGIVEKAKIKTEHDPEKQVAQEALENAKRLRAKGELSDEDVKKAERTLQSVETKLALEQAETRLGKTKFENEQADRKRRLEKMTIRAPMDGIVESVLVARNALINAGATVAHFYSNQRVVMAKIGEEDISRVKVGQKAKVRLLNLPSDSFDAEVLEILPFADPDTQRYTVKLKVEAPVEKLLPNSTGEVAITVGEHPNQPLVHRLALFDDRYVFVVKNGVVEQREIKTGFKALNVVEVTANLQPGEQVIVQDVRLFHAGQRVTVAK